MNATDARTAYLGNSVVTASPARLLVMLLERLVLDGQRALEAQRAADWPEAHRHFVHAQDVVGELQASLRPEAMAGGRELAALYEYLRRRLVDANVGRDLDATASAVEMIEQLCETWRTAATAAAVAPVVATPGLR